MCNSTQISGETFGCGDFHDWIGIVAHDINNYITALLLGTRMVHLKCETASREELAADMDRVYRTVEKVNGLMHQILESTQMLNTPVQSQWLEANIIIDDCIQHFQLQAQAKQIKLSSQIHLQDKSIYTDHKLLSVVLSNLVSNAIKFAPLESHITIYTTDNDNWVCFGVEDQGPGLSAEEQAAVFQNFGIMSAKPTGGETSNGLGLYIVHRFVKLLGGKVWAESAGKGQGTIFNVALPRQQEF